jgi:hypothetical protein
MSILNISHPLDFTNGGKMRADQWSDAVDSIEDVFQSGVHGENFADGSIRGTSFRKNGLTQVFRRRSVGSPWVCWPTKNTDFADIPGGALRFRLRAPAKVVVYFSAKILRSNSRDVTLADHALGFGNTDRNPKVQDLTFRADIRGFWEGEREEPGDEYTQARTLISVGSLQDRPNVSRSIFMPWVIRPMDGLNPKPLDGLRMHSEPVSLLNRPEPGLLMAGWHNIRHVLSLRDDGGGRENDPPVVISDTELIVIADYGPSRGLEVKDRPIPRDLRTDFG